MTASRKLIVGNWKMNGLRQEALALAGAVANGAEASESELVVCPPATLLTPIAPILVSTAIALGAQDCHYESKGAFTGDISAVMLADAGVRYVIVGHSERRAQHQETSDLVRRKAEAAIAAGLVPIICVGESPEVREAGHAEDKVCQELEASLPDVTGAGAVVVAYEPIWAIGTGRTCEVSDIASMHGALRQTLCRRHPALGGVRLLYGGSVKADNAPSILGTADVDGALVGGASLDAASFLAIGGQKNTVGQAASTR